MWFVALQACLAPEQGIDDSRVQGTVVVPATRLAEDDKNATAALADDLGVIDVGYLFVDGSINDFATHTDGTAGKQDVDWLAFTVDAAHAGALVLALGDAPLPMPLPGGTDTDTDPVDTDTDPVDTEPVDSGFDSGVIVEAPIVSVSIADLSDPAAPEQLLETTLSGEGGALASFDFEPGIPYGVRLGGLVGDAETSWELAFPGVHPDDAGILVGAYASSDTSNLGPPVGGTSPGAFTLQDDASYTADYEAVFMLSFTRDTAGEPIIDESLAEVWMLAATWPNLNAGLRSGTLYSSTPAHVTLDGAGTYPADPLVLDAYAASVVGVTIAEEEPNDLDPNADPFSPTGAQAITGLSPAGFVDTLTGTVTWSGAGYGTGAHDVDAFLIRPEADVFVFSVLDWTDGSDLDWYLVDSAGDDVDFGATYDHPEVGGGVVLSAGTDYTVLVVGFEPEDPTLDTAYSLTLEWATP